MYSLDSLPLCFYYPLVSKIIFLQFLLLTTPQKVVINDFLTKSSGPFFVLKLFKVCLIQLSLFYSRNSLLHYLFVTLFPLASLNTSLFTPLSSCLILFPNISQLWVYPKLLQPLELRFPNPLEWTTHSKWKKGTYMER